MSSSLPPPYYTTVAALQVQHRDAASLIRTLSQDIVRTDETFHQVYVLLEGKQSVGVSSSSLKDEWLAVQKTFHSVIWSARRTATEVEVRNGDFVEVIVPVVGDAHESKESKIEELKIFLAKQPPKFLTSTEVSDKLQEINTGMTHILKKYGEDANRMVASAHNDIVTLENERENQKSTKEESSKSKPSGYSLFGSKKPAEPVQPSEPVDYDSKIALANSMIEAVNNQREAVRTKVTEIRHSLATIPDQVGTCFSTVWTHLTTEATHLKNRMEGSTTDPLPDFNAIQRVYSEINSALKYYATNVNKMHA